MPGLIPDQVDAFDDINSEIEEVAPASPIVEAENDKMAPSDMSDPLTVVSVSKHSKTWEIAPSPPDIEQKL